MLLAALVVLFIAGMLRGLAGTSLAASNYRRPDEAAREVEDLARAHAGRCDLVEIGRSTEGRPIVALRFARGGAAGPRPRVLVTAQIHAVEYVAGCVARGVARRLAQGEDGHIARLLDRADVWIVPLLNPDGAERVWRSGGRGGVGPQRFTANGVDPNRNFPTGSNRGARGWNTARDRPGSAYYRGPYPLSEPECLALARLARRERFCAAINFHSFGGVVFLPAVEGRDAARARHAFAVFEGPFQAHQRHTRYRPVPDRSARIAGQLDPFLLDAFGTISVTVEVSRLDRRMLKPWRLANFFWWANPEDPTAWVDNDADAAIHALIELVERTRGEPCTPAHPELAAQVG